VTSLPTPGNHFRCGWHLKIIFRCGCDITRSWKWSRGKKNLNFFIWSKMKINFASKLYYLTRPKIL
jgi:hypothetical protein